MRQLVELQKQAEQFKELNAELIFVYREEQEGVDGLKKIRDQQKTTFTLALDKDKKSSQAYSSERMTFDNYVIDSQGIIRKQIDGTLRERASAEQILEALKELKRPE